jgi:hypothetical protein
MKRQHDLDLVQVWSGYALEPIRARWNTFQAGVVLGVVRAIWHLLPLAQASRSPAWIAWWSSYQ